MPGPFSFTVQTKIRRLMPPDEAEYYVGGEAILKRMVRAGWLRSKIKQRKLTRYDLRDLDHAIDRLGEEELPA